MHRFAQMPQLAAIGLRQRLQAEADAEKIGSSRRAPCRWWALAVETRRHARPRRQHDQIRCNPIEDPLQPPARGPWSRSRRSGGNSSPACGRRNPRGRRAGSTCLSPTLAVSRLEPAAFGLPASRDRRQHGGSLESSVSASSSAGSESNSQASRRPATSAMPSFLHGWSAG